MGFIEGIFNFFIIDPMINGLALLYYVFFEQFWLSIVIFTIFVRLATLPLTLKQTRQMRAMSALQPRMRQIQERYAGDRGRASQETMKLYREAGVNPLGCFGPMLIQLPIWIGLFQALRVTLPTDPDSLIGLAQRFYAWLPPVHETVPLDSDFLWLDLANPDPSPFIMPILVAASTWAQQKMTTMPAMDDRQASTNRMMLWMMPLMLGFFTLSFPSGLALYWITSNVIGVGIQYFQTGWGPLFNRSTPAPAQITPPGTPESGAPESGEKESETDGSNRSDNVRTNRRRGARTGSQRTRRRSGRSRNRNSKPR